MEGTKPSEGAGGPPSKKPYPPRSGPSSLRTAGLGEEEEVAGAREEAVAVPIRDGAGPTSTRWGRQGGAASLARERTPSRTAEGQ
ncbi:unnamed protein product [Ectocarpus sp. CCAP 1310/34]|nr:unnamed protein product [Ectocarpus sp. CCAP 1310/34]